MNRTRAASLSILVPLLAIAAAPAQADAATTSAKFSGAKVLPTRAAASDAKARTAKAYPVSTASVRPRCGRRGKLRRVHRGYVCRRGLTDRRPKCRRGYKVRARGAGWVCRRKRKSARANPVSPVNPGNPTGPAPIGDQERLNAAFYFAKKHGDQLLGNQGAYSTYWWLVDPKQCSIVDYDTSRCVLWVWRESWEFYGAIRTVHEVDVLAHHVGNNTYSLNFYEPHAGAPSYYVCSDTYLSQLPHLPNCDGPR